MTDSPVYGDLGRPPLQVASLRRGIVQSGSLWRELQILPSSASTNADVAVAARAGADEGLVVVAEHQVAGRGRLDRVWVTPPRAALTFSVLLRPGPTVPAARWGWIPLLAGVAVATALGRLAEVSAAVKWPNDVLIGGRKVAGLLAEVVGTGPEAAIVLGIGLNVSTRRDELPVPTATSLALEAAACTDRDPLLRATLRALGEDYEDWRSRRGDPADSGLAARYAACSDTLGRQVTVSMPTGQSISGVAEGVDDLGRLLVRSRDGVQRLSAGDVTHVRAASDPRAGADGPLA